MHISGEIATRKMLTRDEQSWMGFDDVDALFPNRLRDLQVVRKAPQTAFHARREWYITMPCTFLAQTVTHTPLRSACTNRRRSCRLYAPFCRLRRRNPGPRDSPQAFGRRPTPYQHAQADILVPGRCVLWRLLRGASAETGYYQGKTEVPERDGYGVDDFRTAWGWARERDVT